MTTTKKHELVIEDDSSGKKQKRIDEKDDPIQLLQALIDKVSEEDPWRP